MGLDTSKLQKLKLQGNAMIARCPACAQEGRDNKGNHLFIAADGRFGCVMHPGDQGRSHRQKIFELVGKKDHISAAKIVIKPSKKTTVNAPEVIESNIFGTLGTDVKGTMG